MILMRIFYILEKLVVPLTNKCQTGVNDTDKHDANIEIIYGYIHIHTFIYYYSRHVFVIHQ